MRLLSALAIAVALALPSTSAAAPPTLTGETFEQHRPTIVWADCRTEIKFGYVATGAAGGPYPGTFVEWGMVSDDGLRATFAIHSPVGKVTGVKTGPIGRSCVSNFTCFGIRDCERASVGYNTTPGIFDRSNPYVARIKTTRRTVRDSGLFQATFFHSPTGDLPFDGFDSAFQSGAAP